MEFVNETGLPAGWTMGFDKDGRELIVVVIKASFDMPEPGQAAELSAQQVPLAEADTFTGQPGLTAPLHEADFAHRKPHCDVLLLGSAYAPGGVPQQRVPVGLRVAQRVKSFGVTGERLWSQRLGRITAGDPQPFLVQPFSYDLAYGGVDTPEDPGRARAYLANPVGRGFQPSLQRLDGVRMPCTEDWNEPITRPDGSYQPMSLGPVGRNWAPRAAFAGTYDEAWATHRAPFWPDDLDDRYFQAAPADQQIPYPVGGEAVTLMNLTPDGRVSFELPRLSLPVRFVPHRGDTTLQTCTVDTIVFEPDQGRFTMTARTCLSMRRHCLELKQIIAGEPSQAWYRARRKGNKPYYKSLADLVRSRRS